ncbi:hypothetical protein [Paenibacillus eucommiae]|uniref:Uncharacterized protein n=1 Tax=Paenibacillus eucommiae TaxID=1355755 RepID=A0ABS4J3K6_9BACL|nr:hypothetical protein [Paenibacillus eucommiae]MBP1994429.1 hypothetical protein [Paenibacillus eucommiae]
MLHDYFVWDTVKKIGKALSLLIEEPVMTAGYIKEEIFELSIFENLREAWDSRTEDLDDFIRITSPEQAVDKLSELVRMSMWSDPE